MDISGTSSIFEETEMKELSVENLLDEPAGGRKIGLKYSVLRSDGVGFLAAPTKEKCHSFLHKSGFKQLLLLVSLGLYSLIGGVVFCRLENPLLELNFEKAMNESKVLKETKLQNREILAKRVEEIFTDLHYHIERLAEDYGGQNDTELIKLWTKKRHFLLERKKESLLGAIQWYDDENDCLFVANVTARRPWDIWEGVFYAWTLYSTIGYGNIYAQTKGGQIATVVYSLIGIPLLITLLNEWGQFLFSVMLYLWNKFLQILRAAKAGCSWGWRRRPRPGRRERIRSLVAISTVTIADNQDRNLWKNARRAMHRPSDAVAHPGDSPTVLTADLPIALVLLIFLFWICFSAAVYCVFEDWTYFTSFYFVFVSLTTIGLGDVAPAHPKYTVLSLILVLVCLSVISMALSVVQWKIESLFGRMIRNIDAEYQRKSQEEHEKKEEPKKPAITKSVKFQDAATDPSEPVIPSTKIETAAGPEAKRTEAMDTIVEKEGLAAKMLFGLMDKHKKQLIHQHHKKRSDMRQKSIQTNIGGRADIGVQAGPDDISKPVRELYPTSEWTEERRKGVRSPFSRDVYVYNV